MRTIATLGDFLSEAQLRTLVKDYQVEQRYGSMGRPARSRGKGSLSGVDAVRARVQNYRHKRQRGEWKSKTPYISVDDAIERYERRGEHLESCEQMFAIGQGQRFKKKADIRANVIKGGRGGIICRRPTIDEGKGTNRRIRRTVDGKTRAMVGFLM